MRLIFAGTPEFALCSLRALAEAGHDIALVLTQPDRPAGRGMKMHGSPVKQFALERGFATAQPRSLRLDGRFPDDAALARQALTEARADAMVVAAYGLILPRWVLDAMRAPGQAGAPALGCINVHASLLPRWRGAAPIHRAIEAGDAQTGVTIMQMDEGLDTGDMLLTDTCPIHHSGDQRDTTGSLHDRLAALGGVLVVRALGLAAEGRLSPHPQPADGVTYAHKVEKAQAAIDWNADADLIERGVRAFNPTPGAWTMLDAEVLKVWRAALSDVPVAPGTVPGTVLQLGADGIDVACGRGSLRVTELQRAGGKRLAAAAFQRGFALQPGTRFAAASPA